ncbi:MAG: diguanylate cyclase [Zetaproteobacteria bacterium]|nr:MAG: diguanylate cyclase [Zetaproteobacteria bacterium]
MAAPNDRRDAVVDILLLDDDRDDALLLSAMAEEQMGGRLRLHCCTTCTEADALIEQRGIDLCLVDYHLNGGVNGLQWAEQCHRTHGVMGPALILLTGVAEIDEIDARAGDEDNGIIDFLVKQELTPTLLARTIRFATKQQRLLREMHLREMRARLLFDHAREGIVILDDHGRITQANRAAERLFDYAPGTMPGLYLSQLIPDFSMNLLRTMGRDARPVVSDSSIQRVTAFDRTGRRRDLEMSLGIVHSEHDHFYTAGFLDIGHHLAAVEAMRQQAHTDELTGLMNRRCFRQQADQELGRARRNGQPISLMMIDIDHFKRVNDRYGHAVGDAVLRKVADRLRQDRRELDLLCRWGGEEFLMMLPDSDLSAARALAERLRGNIERLTFDRFPEPVTISIGIAPVDPDQPLKQATQQADQALYRAKEAGRNCVRCAAPRARP